MSKQGRKNISNNIPHWLNKNEVEDYKTQKKRIEENLKRKDYLLTVYTNGNKCFSEDVTSQAFPNKYREICSLEEIPEYIEKSLFL